MAVEAGAGRDEANPAERWKNKLMFIVARTAKKSLGTMDHEKFRASEQLVRSYLSREARRREE